MPPDTPNTDGWPKWSTWVVEGLRETKNAIDVSRKETKADIAILRAEIKEDIVSVRADVNQIKVDVAMLQVKAGLWGAFGAAIPIIIMFAVQYMQYLRNVQP